MPKLPQVESRRFTDRVTVVTGAASGVGRATAARLITEGGTVVGVDVNADGLAEAAAELGERFEPATVDLRSPAECVRVVESAATRHGRLDGLANVAGVLRQGHLADLTPEEVALVLDVNVSATLWTCKAAMPHLVAADGAVVNVASNTALQGGAYSVLYSASKGAVVAMTRSLAAEFVKASVRINAVAPGGIRTAMAAGAQLPDDVDWDLIQPLMGFRRMATPEDIAGLIAWMLSDEARNVHGAVFSSDAALTAL